MTSSKTVKGSLLLLLVSTMSWSGLVSGLAPSSQLTPEQIEKIQNMVTSKCNSGDYTGVTYITQGEDVVYEHACGAASREFGVPNTIKTKFMIGSNTKSFAATLTLRLIQDGVTSKLTGKPFKLDGKVSDYLPYYPKLIGDNVTLEQLMAMRSGIPNNTVGNNMSYFNVVNRLFTTPENGIIQTCIPELYQYAGKSMKDVPYDYSNCNYNMLGDIIEKGTGKSFEEVLKEYILEPAEMMHSGMYDYFDLKINTNLANIYNFDIYKDNQVKRTSIQDPTTVFSSGAMYSTVKDFQKWNSILYTDKVLNQKYRDKMFYPYSGYNVPGCLFYGLGWGIMYANKGNFLPGTSYEECKTDQNRSKVPFYLGSYANNSYATILRVTETNRAAMLFFNYVGPNLSSDLLPFLGEIASILAANKHQAIPEP